MSRIKVPLFESVKNPARSVIYRDWQLINERRGG